MQISISLIGVIWLPSQNSAMLPLSLLTGIRNCLQRLYVLAWAKDIETYKM